MVASHVSNEYEKSERFYIHTPSRVNELPYLRGRGFRSNPHLLPSASVHQSASDKGPFHQLAMGYRTLLPITWLSATGVRGGAAAAGHDRMDLCRIRSDEYSRRGEGVVWI